jgi:phospholipid N-methyltransferase
VSIAEEASTFTFARTFFKNPRMLGSVIPSSRWLVDQLLRHVDWDAARVIVEYGPGVGTISRDILKRMRPDATLVTIELNTDFVEVMKRNFHDPRLRVVHRSAADVNEILAELGLGKADYVIAGIPFSIMSDQDRDAVLRNAHTALRDTGVLLIYQFSGKVKRDLMKLFAKVKSSFEPRNILPARVFVCSKT